MVDPLVLKKFGCTDERLREIFTCKGSADVAACPDDASKEDKEKYEKAKHKRDCDYKIRQRFEDRIWCRILEGIGVNCKNARPYQAVDMAMDAPPITKESVPLLLWAQGKIDIKGLSKCLDRDCGAEQAKKFFTKTDQGTLKLNIPRITETPVNIVRSYVTRRLAAMDALWSNLWPLLKYDSRAKDPVSQLRADALTQRVDIMSDAYGYRHMGSQWRRDMLMYSKSTVFPRQKWERKIQWRFKQTNTGAQSEDVESYVEREGVDMVNSHPSRTYYDLNTPLAGLNTNTGPTYIGYWDIVRFGSLVECKDKPYYNTDQLWITDGWTGLFQQYADFFGYYFDPCVLKWPDLKGGDPSNGNNRTSNIGRYVWGPLIDGAKGPNNDSRDCGVVIAQHFEKFNPKTEGIGDYDAEVWVRFCIGGAGTVMFAEFLPSLPAITGGINVNDSRLENQSMAMELLSYQDQVTNVVTTMIEQLRSSFVQLWLLDKDVLDEETLKKFKDNAENREWWMEPKLLVYSSSKNAELLGKAGSAEAAFKIVQSGIGQTIAGAITAMGQLLNLADRLLILSPNELGQPNPREVSARESQEISTSVQSIYSFINQGPREINAAFKELLYESLVCCGTDRFAVPTLKRYTKKTIKDAGFKTETEVEVKDGQRLPVSTVVLGSLKDLRYDYAFDSRDGADRVASSQIIQGMVQLLQILQPFLTKEQAFEYANAIVRGSGLPLDMPFEVPDGQDPDEGAAAPPQPQPGQPQGAPPQQPQGGLPPEIQQMIQMQDRRIQNLEQLIQRFAGGGQAPAPPVPPPPAQAASGPPPASRLSVS